MLPEGADASVEAERMLTVREAACRLGVSTATVYKLCARGDLVHARVLNVLRIPLAALAVLMAGAPSRKA